MWVRVDGAGVRLVEAENFRAFGVELVDGVELAGQLEGVGVVEGEHVYLDAEAVKGLPGASGSEEWRAGFDNMVGYARSKGWVDEAGRVRAHIERR